MGFAVRGGVRSSGLSLLQDWKRDSEDGKDAQERSGELVAGCVHLSRKEARRGWSPCCVDFGIAER